MKRWACSMVPHIGIWVRGQSYIGWRRKLYSFGLIPIQLCEVTSIRLLLCVGIKVVDEWQISLGYVRGSNIYVRGYLDLCAWSLRLRTQTEENHYVKALFSSRERCFSLRRIRGIRAMRRRACVSLQRAYRGAGRAMPQHSKQGTGVSAIVSTGQSYRRIRLALADTTSIQLQYFHRFRQDRFAPFLDHKHTLYKNV